MLKHDPYWILWWLGQFWHRIKHFELLYLKILKCLKFSVSVKNHPITTKFGGESHTYDIDLNPKNEKNPFENVTGRGNCGRTDRQTDERTDAGGGGMTIYAHTILWAYKKATLKCLYVYSYIKHKFSWNPWRSFMEALGLRGTLVENYNNSKYVGYLSKIKWIWKIKLLWNTLNWKLTLS